MEQKSTPSSRTKSQRWIKCPRQWMLLLEAGTLLLLARAALRCLPTARIVSWVRRPLTATVSATTEAELAQMQWAVLSFSRNAPLRLVCFPQALAMHAMLRRRGLVGEVLYGAARLKDGKLAAHAWLRSHGRLWVGAEAAEEFTVLDVWKPAEVPASNQPGSPN